VALSGPTKSRILNKESETTSETNTNSSASPSLLSKEEYAKSKEKHKEYLEGLRKRHPEVALFGINEKRKGVLANLYEYPSDVQDMPERSKKGFKTHTFRQMRFLMRLIILGKHHRPMFRENSMMAVLLLLI